MDPNLELFGVHLRDEDRLRTISSALDPARSSWWQLWLTNAYGQGASSDSRFDFVSVVFLLRWQLWRRQRTSMLAVVVHVDDSRIGFAFLRS
jgi:hypothetical protein